MTEGQSKEEEKSALREVIGLLRSLMQKYDSLANAIPALLDAFNKTNSRIDVLATAFPSAEDGGLVGHLLDHTVRRRVHGVLVKVIIGLSVALGGFIAMSSWELAKAHYV